MDSLLSAVIAKESKENIANDEYLNLLFDFLALFVPGEERNYCWVQFVPKPNCKLGAVYINHFKGEFNSIK